jgi:hypothetical protein
MEKLTKENPAGGPSLKYKGRGEEKRKQDVETNKNDRRSSGRSSLTEG